MKAKALKSKEKSQELALKINKLEFSYRKGKPLLRGLSLTLSSGHVYGLLGQNGAGKTTLLKIMAGLCFPDAGTVEMLGQNPSKRSPAFLKEIFFMPEDFTLPPMDALRYAQYYGSFYPRFDQSIFLSCLDTFDVPQAQLCSSLSHGQKKLFLMSFALATRVKFLILDEPTNGLDIPNKQVWQGVMAKQIEPDQLVLISTHQVHDIESVIDSVLIVKQGKIVLNAPLSLIEEKLHFGSASTRPDTALYSEQRAGGYCFVQVNIHKNESLTDLTLLFNAVLNNAEIAPLLGDTHV